MAKMSAKKIEKLAKEIREYLLKHELWVDVRIYFNGKAFSTDDGHGNYGYNDPNKLFVIEDVDPRRYFDYCGDILSMSFEGPLYDVMNYTFGELEEGLVAIFEKYGCYYELGNAWNLTLYKN